MCGILGIMELENGRSQEQREQLTELSMRQRHRGPDWSGYYMGPEAVFAHERLAIIGMESGEQPLFSANGELVLVVNGEIYNYKELSKRYSNYQYQSDSDCEVILPLFMDKGTEFLNDLRGMFAFILYNTKTKEYLIARDHMGIIPLYTGYDEKGLFYVSSEMKCIADSCTAVNNFPPGHYLDSRSEGPEPYYRPHWFEFAKLNSSSEAGEANEKKEKNTGTIPAMLDAESADREIGERDLATLRQSLEDSVHSHLMSDVPYGVLLSGGLDSSLIAAIAARYARRRVEDDGQSEAWWPRLHSFAIGLEGSPDLEAAQKVATRLGTVHHNFHFTTEDGLHALSQVIYHLETYDVTTIRAATPMYLLARKIKSMGIKMVLSGEGSDEIFGGYLYFHHAPNPRELHEETVRKLQRLHHYDCLRANKAMMAWGVEPRVPFLDRRFLDVAMRFNPANKMVRGGGAGAGGRQRGMEKWLLRKAFEGYLDDEILWRQKEQFSDGVGYRWIDSLKELAEHEISDANMKRAGLRFAINPPGSKEAYLYRSIFEKQFPNASAALTVPQVKSVACSTETGFEWLVRAGKLPANAELPGDPSGRAVLDVHRDAYES
ncbi:asparagine synthase B [Candidatus Haliotispira prima]|uniref:asparagine synthase (glutamine-hydrolyzing) n=1 Tax=Candidatus Haliotispira prima TaxID=3034016 RepID=A0ABY8MH00_9SPIO|nr:asparagine synthase B [Candidatus Haliotispira prima]